QTVVVKGPKAELSETINDAVKIEMVDGESGKEVLASVTNETDKNERAQWGTARALIANMVAGVTTGFSKQLEVNGVGYRVNLQGRTLVLNVGFSHEVRVDLPEGVDAAVEGNLITLTSASKHDVGELADAIRKIRKPEPYKGKGIKYVDEVIRRKAGKTQKAGE
ncbi:MAG: 50S ribosomal protein L6, partial [bacterium]|nr:50S ribosomal protein L6 [bacterium]